MTQVDTPLLDVSGTKPVPFTRLVTVELRKMGDTRAGKWLLIAIAVITVLAVGLLAIFGKDGDHTFVNYMGTTGTPQGFLLPVLGVLLVTSEWGQRSALTTFTLVPHRGRILVAKIVAAFLFGLGAIVVAMAVAALATVLHGGPDAWANFSGDDVLKYVLLQTIGIWQGLAFGMLFLNSAAAIVIFFVVPIAWSIVTSLVPGLRDAQPWIDLGTAQAPLFGDETMSGKEWAQLLVTTLIWVALPMGLGAMRVLRAEVK